MKSIFQSLQFVLTLTMSIVAFLAMGMVAILFFNKMIAQTEDSVAINSSQVVEQVAGTVNVYVRDMMDISDQIASDIKTSYTPADKLRGALETTKRMRKDIVSIAIFNSKGKIIDYAPSDYVVKENLDIFTQEWYLDFPSSDTDYFFTPPHVQNLFEGQYKWVATLCRPVQIHTDTGDYVLTLIMDMNFESIAQYCDKLRIGKRGYVFILDEFNNIIYHPQQQVIYSGLKNEDINFIGQKPPGTYISKADGKIVTISPVMHTNWKVAGITYLDDYELVYLETARYILMTSGAIILLVALLAYITSLSVSGPIKRLAAQMEKMERENFSEKVPVKGFSELKSLSSSFNKMTLRIASLMEQITLEQQELRKMELRALQAQINPHFLYNTLDSILWMCERGDGKNAVIMVSALSDLFRISISKGSELITIKEELIHAASYLTIQKMRYKDQFDYVINADEELLECKCLKVILQPLLENAIYHGIDRMVDRGMLVITVRRSEDKILMQVKDNGLGIDPEKLIDIFEPKKESDNKYGIGVANVNKRIHIYFGMEYGIELRSVPDEGTQVNILLPVIE